MRLPLIFNKSTKDMASLSGIFSTNINLIKGHTPQIAGWLIPALVDDIEAAKEEARVA
jgi:hypothetical protein